MTKADLLAETARELHILADGQTLSAERQAKLDRKYLALHAMLLEKPGLVTWSLTESIPARCERPIIAMLAALSVNEFGVAGDRKALLILMGALDADPPSLAERQLRKAQSRPYISTPLKTCQY